MIVAHQGQSQDDFTGDETGRAAAELMENANRQLDIPVVHENGERYGEADDTVVDEELLIQPVDTKRSPRRMIDLSQADLGRCVDVNGQWRVSRGRGIRVGMETGVDGGGHIDLRLHPRTVRAVRAGRGHGEARGDGRVLNWSVGDAATTDQLFDENRPGLPDPIALLEPPFLDTAVRIEHVGARMAHTLVAIPVRNSVLHSLRSNPPVSNTEAIDQLAPLVADEGKADLVLVRERSQHTHRVVADGVHRKPGVGEFVQPLLQLDQLRLAEWSPIGAANEDNKRSTSGSMRVKIDRPTELVRQEEVRKPLPNLGTQLSELRERDRRDIDGVPVLHCPNYTSRARVLLAE